MWCAQLGCAVAIVLITYFKLSHITNFGVNLGQRARPRSLAHSLKLPMMCLSLAPHGKQLPGVTQSQHSSSLLDLSVS